MVGLMLVFIGACIAMGAYVWTILYLHNLIRLSIKRLDLQHDCIVLLDKRIDLLRKD